MKVFLIGMMGSGKSYWSKILAQRFQIPHFDLDDLIEEQEQRTIAEIFATDGEAYFRRKETEVLQKMAHIPSFILATGGGTPCFSDNIQWMNKEGVTIWIDESAERLAERLKPEKAHRPLLQNLNDQELLGFLQGKITQRTPYYIQAHHRLSGNPILPTDFQQIL